MQRRTFPAEISALGDNEVLIRMSTGDRARDGHILDPGGCVLDNYRANPIQLWQHDPNEPVGTNSDIAIAGGCIEARTTFAPPGISATADKVRGLVKAGVVRAVSIGFEILDATPIDPARPCGGLHATSWELLECSFVSVPADTGAVVTARATADEDWKVGASRTLPIDETDDEWDGPAAAAAIFDWAGGDDFDPKQARKGFLVYDAAAPKLRGSYKLPIARVVDGRLKVPKAAIRAAASRLSQTDIPGAVQTAAGEVLDHYKEKAGMAVNDEGRAAAVKRLRAVLLTQAAEAPRLRGLYDVSRLACLLGELGYATDNAHWEASLEKDGSAVPAMLGEALAKLGAALIAMTQEEVAELLANASGTAAIEDEMGEGDRAWLRTAKTDRVRAWRAASVLARAGKSISAANAAKLGAAAGHVQAAADHAATAAAGSDKATEAHGRAADAHAAALATHEKLGAALADAKANPDDAAKHITRAITQHGALARNLDAVTDAHDAQEIPQGDAADAVTASTRCLRAATRCLRSVLDGVTDDDGDEANIPGTSADGDGSEADRAFSPDARRRRAALLELAAT